MASRLWSWITGSSQKENNDQSSPEQEISEDEEDVVEDQQVQKQSSSHDEDYKDAAQSYRGILPSEVSPEYLHSNSTSHTWAFSAIAELIDNAYDPDVSATELYIDTREINSQTCLTFIDNGNGMCPDKLHKMLSFGYSEKIAVGRHQPIGRYGNGFKSGSMRLGKDALVFTKQVDTMNVGLLSQSYLKAVKATTVLVPIATWNRLDDQRQNCTKPEPLAAICNHSLFGTEEELLHEMREFIVGTKIIIYNLKKNENTELELDFKSDPEDIRNPESHLIDKSATERVIREKSPEYRVSLKEYCSILYLTPRLKIFVRGTKVKTRLVAHSLSKKETDPYKPIWSEKPIPIKFGFTRPKKGVPDDYGIMLYQKNRLIQAYEKVGYQKQANELGVGVVGIVEANFLTPIHNKQDFVRDNKYNALMANVASKLNDYWNEKKGNPNTAEEKEEPPNWEWAQCENCLQWRRLPSGVNVEDLPEKWYCYMNLDRGFNRCEIPQEKEDEEEVVKPSYKKTFKKKMIEQRKKVKLKVKKEDNADEMKPLTNQGDVGQEMDEDSFIVPSTSTSPNKRQQQNTGDTKIRRKKPRNSNSEIQSHDITTLIDWTDTPIQVSAEVTLPPLQQQYIDSLTKDPKTWQDKYVQTDDVKTKDESIQTVTEKSSMKYKRELDALRNNVFKFLQRRNPGMELGSLENVDRLIIAEIQNQ